MMPEVAPMLIVCAEEARVEAELVGGLLACSSCRGLLGPWGHARARVVRCTTAGDRRGVAAAAGEVPGVCGDACAAAGSGAFAASR